MTKIETAFLFFLFGFMLARSLADWAKRRAPKQLSMMIGNTIAKSMADVRDQNRFCGQAFETRQTTVFKQQGETDVFVVVTTKDPQP